MVRAILGVIVGYVAMFVVVFAGLTVAYLVMGADGAFAPGAWDASMTWILTSFVVGLVAAVVGGLVCALVARAGSKAYCALSVLVLVLGLGMAGLAMAMPEPEEVPERTSETNNWEAMTYAKQPTWVMFANPVIGAIGVVIGARMRGGGGATDAAPPAE
jgi:hypothetical protein